MLKFAKLMNYETVLTGEMVRYNTQTCHMIVLILFMYLIFIIFVCFN